MVDAVFLVFYLIGGGKIVKILCNSIGKTLFESIGVLSGIAISHATMQF